MTIAYDIQPHDLVGAVEKMEVLKKEYGIKTTDRLRKGMRQMCNLSEAIEEQGIWRGIQQGRLAEQANTERERKRADRAEAELDGRRYPACVNSGVHPTLGALPAPVLEANLIGFSGNLYGKELAVWLEDHLRGELRFESLEALRARVLYDRQLVADFYQT